MKAKFIAIASVVFAAASLSAAASAECIYPKTPGFAPDGSTATKDEMLAGQQAFTKYNSEVNAYLNCLAMDADTQVKAIGDKPEDAGRVTQIKAMADKRHNAAIEELHARAEEFNVQLRVYKAKNKD